VKINADANISALIHHLAQVQPKQDMGQTLSDVQSVEPASELTEQTADKELDSGADLLAAEVWTSSNQSRATDMTSFCTPPVGSLESMSDWADYIFGRDPFSI